MGIGGERNGIADLAAVSDFATRALGSDGLDMDALAEAYRYLASILVSKVGETFLFDNLPFFGANARSTLPAPTLPSVGGSSGVGIQHQRICRKGNGGANTGIEGHRCVRG